jgi:ribosomal protein S18
METTKNLKYSMRRKTMSMTMVDYKQIHLLRKYIFKGKTANKEGEKIIVARRTVHLSAA